MLCLNSFYNEVPNRQYCIVLIIECVFSYTFCRTARQAERKARMQDRWNFLKEEINSIHKTKETARRNAERRKLFVSRSMFIG